MDSFFNKDNLLEILDRVEEGIHIVDKNGRIVYYNKFAEKIDAVDTKKAIGRHLLEVYPSLTYETSTLLTVIRTGKPILKVEQTFINYKGEKITTINSTFPIRDKKGNIIGAIELSRDITQVREMSEQIVDLQNRLYNNKNKSNTKENLAKYTFLDIIGENKAMLRLKKIGLKAAESTAPVLIYGDTGTGKELFVHAIHNASKRRKKPFIAQNCAALPANLLEGILFGTVKGGFTGAEDRKGLFELADGGTLFLDEINSMPLDLQPKLLRVLEDNSFRPIGGTRDIVVDVRIIAATNIPPEEAVKNNLLRKDLFYRLNVIRLDIPALKERKDDIPLLANYFIKKYNEKLNKSVKGVSNEVMEILRAHPWEGNVRELENLIEGIMSIYDTDMIELEHLPLKFRKVKGHKGNKSLKDILEDMEKDLILEALHETGYNITKAAEILNIPRQTLQYKISKYSIR
ncbi:MAG: sigma 54-interacting transcriptional regulator [Tissierellia bacterium]|nr:sigma 54-interacting transcriptional regulator [Tissierellia bacterium]